MAFILLQDAGMGRGLIKIAFVIGLCACAGPRTAGAPSDAADRQSEAERRMILTAQDLKDQTQASGKMQPGDLLEITIFKEADMNRTIRISGNGTITFPLVGSLKVADLSVPEAESLLAGKLADFLVKPQVTVLVKEYGNKQIYVLGEVKKPGSIQLPAERRLTVLEAITLAGGFTDLAAPDRTKVLRAANGRNQSIRVEISRITKQGDKSADIFLEPNDTVFVPQSFF